ncbi:helix-turn-helix domain-containing protein [Arthrobacter sp. E3]|uniref:helix-turn-helix domain-containing protein n=1 Tax=Arthrobacter sp. E3 TaxID=517402 RepID=UPI001FFC2CBF|nr:helix-turn-helix domain-containing protein [Arthrobacter sp. E3]
MAGLAAAHTRRAKGESDTQIAKALGISRASIYRHFPSALPEPSHQTDSLAPITVPLHTRPQGPVLIHTRDGVLQPQHLAHLPGSHESYRMLDCGFLQTETAPLRPELPEPARLRTQTQARPTSAGKSRLTNHPRFAENLPGAPLTGVFMWSILWIR